MTEQEQEALAGAYHMTPLDEQILTIDVRPMVDLSLVYSPVITQHGTLIKDVLRTQGGGYLLNYGRPTMLNGSLAPVPHAEVVTEGALRFMRARYLIRRGYYALYFDCQPLAYYERDRLLHDYFNGALYQFPEDALHKQRRGWRLHLEAVRNAQPPDKNTVEGQLWELGRLLVPKGIGF